MKLESGCANDVSSCMRLPLIIFPLAEHGIIRCVSQKSANMLSQERWWRIALQHVEVCTVCSSCLVMQGGMLDELLAGEEDKR